MPTLPPTSTNTAVARPSITQFAATDAPAVVPKEAEVILETRLPYLTDKQRRTVLRTTALPSGFPVMDFAEGIGRPV